MRFFLFTLLLTLFFSCKKEQTPHPYSGSKKKDNAQVTDSIFISNDLSSPTILSGTYGIIKEWEGDFMPTLGPGGPSGTITPVSNNILIYELLTFEDVKGSFIGGYPPFINKKLFKQTPLFVITPNASGFYQIELPPGKYSYLIEIENNQYYGSMSNNQGHFNSFSVEENKAKQMDINLQYKATF